MTTPRHRQLFRTLTALAAALAISSCSSGEAATSQVAPAPDAPTTDGEAPTTTAAPTTVAPTTTAPPTTTPATTTAPPTTASSTEDCGSSCPLSDEAQEVVDEFFEAYNGDDWDAMLAALGTSEPTWNFSPTQTQITELIRYDFIWAAGMGQTTTPVSCVDQYGVIRCDVEIEDDLHRLLAPYGFPTSRCTMTLELAPGGPIPKSFNGFDCFGYYDAAMHVYGDWFEEQYPDSDPIQGLHYRAWNQTDETAGARAAEHLDEWGEVVAAYVADGGDIFDLRPAHH